MYALGRLKQGTGRYLLNHRLNSLSKAPNGRSTWLHEELPLHARTVGHTNQKANPSHLIHGMTELATLMATEICHGEMLMTKQWQLSRKPRIR